MNYHSQPRALITGITGQDGSYLAEFLLEKGYDVHGVVRRTSSLERSRIHHLYTDEKIYNKKLFLHYADLDDSTTLRRILYKIKPRELYHLAGQSHVGLSFEIPESTCDLTAMGAVRLLEMIRDMDDPPRIFHASTSEIFGRPAEAPQTERTPIDPVNPYACSKAFATQMTKVYRESFGLFVCNGIMYNHESPRRGENFVTRKICRAAAAIKAGLQNHVVLGSLDAKRDWGYAPDYVRGMWLGLQQERAEDYIFATGKLHSIEDLLQIAFDTVELHWRDHIRQDPRFIRPAESFNLVGDPSKAVEKLNWRHTKTFEEMIQSIVQSDLRAM